MKLLNNSVEYTVYDFLKTPDTSDIVVVFGEDKPESLVGTYEVKANNDFQLATFNADDFLRQYWNGNALVLTNTPEPEPEPEPEPTPEEPTTEELMDILLGVTE